MTTARDEAPVIMAPSRKALLAGALWVALAIVVWNVIFDRVLVLAGRRYAYEAAVAARAGEPYRLVDDAMRPAIARGVWLASVTAGAIAVLGVVAVVIAARRDRARHPEVARSPLEPRLRLPHEATSLRGAYRAPEARK